MVRVQGVCTVRQRPVRFTLFVSADMAICFSMKPVCDSDKVGTGWGGNFGTAGDAVPGAGAAVLAFVVVGVSETALAGHLGVHLGDPHSCQGQRRHSQTGDLVSCSSFRISFRNASVIADGTNQQTRQLLRHDKRVAPM